MDKSRVLALFEPSAVVDYVTIDTPAGKEVAVQELYLKGRPHWVPSAQFKQLSIHDFAPTDIKRLEAAFPSTNISKLEVSVDFRPVNQQLAIAERMEAIEALFCWVVKHLYPYDAPGMKGANTFLYDPVSPKPYKTREFNYRLPKPIDEVLYGFRDQYAQVKMYCKVRDNGKVVDIKKQSLRMEVTLSRQACQDFGLCQLSDLRQFNFRKALNKYFRMVTSPSVRPRRSIKRRDEVVELAYKKRLSDKQDKITEKWHRLGVQGVRKQESADWPVRYDRLPEINRWIGRALARLSDRFRHVAME